MKTTKCCPKIDLLHNQGAAHITPVTSDKIHNEIKQFLGPVMNLPFLDIRSLTALIWSLLYF